jgi:branched-chain amino acid transport system ATP-binding protein
MSMLELRGIRAGYGRLPVLFDVDLTVEAGEWVGIVGANGAGRSTLLKTILGSGTNVTAGEVFFCGERVTHLSAHRRVAAGISMSPEGRRIFANLSVKENLRTGANNLGKRDMSAQIDKVYGVFPKLEARSIQRAGSLSGGEQQMLAIGRALMSRPKLLLVDELSLGLAPIIVASLTEALQSLCQEEGLGVIVVDEVHQHDTVGSSRRLVLEKGRFVDDLDVVAEQEPFAVAH